jgi:hypothetical protein
MLCTDIFSPKSSESAQQPRSSTPLAFKELFCEVALSLTVVIVMIVLFLHLCHAFDVVEPLSIGLRFDGRSTNQDRTIRPLFFRIVGMCGVQRGAVGSWSSR